MTVRRKQVVTLNVPIDVVAQNVSDVVTGNSLYKNLRVSEDRKELTFTSVLTMWAFPLRWRVQLSTTGTQTAVTVENTSYPFEFIDGLNVQYRYITDFLTTLQRVADQTLLRAASAPTAMSETLLRAADIGTDTDTEELLRPDPQQHDL